MLGRIFSISRTKQRPVKTRRSQGVARQAVAFWQRQVLERVAVTVDLNIDDPHKVSAGFPFSPEAFLRRLEECRHSGLERFDDSLLVCEGDHEILACGGVIYDHHDETLDTIDVPLEFRFEN